jgi:hypothetical protein
MIHPAAPYAPLPPYHTAALARSKGAPARSVGAPGLRQQLLYALFA